MGARGPAPGTPRSPNAGRKKGTPNKDKADTRAVAEKLGIDPFEVLLLFAKGDYVALGYHEEQRIVGYSKMGDPIYEHTVRPDVRARAAKDACEFMLPKFKTVEFKGDAAQNLALTFAELMLQARKKKQENNGSGGST